MSSINRTAVFFIIIGVLLFAMGYHSIDTAWNMHTVNRDFNASYVDVSLGRNVIYTPAEAYRQGCVWIFYGFVAAIYGCLWVNYDFKINWKRKKKEESKGLNFWN